MKSYFVYILASGRNGTLYVGVTNNLEKRTAEHQSGEIEGFTKKYTVHKLVYFEETMDVSAAIQREKNIKHWVRAWKIALIEQMNPNWEDLSMRAVDPRVKPEGDMVIKSLSTT